MKTVVCFQDIFSIYVKVLAKSTFVSACVPDPGRFGTVRIRIRDTDTVFFFSGFQDVNKKILSFFSYCLL